MLPAESGDASTAEGLALVRLPPLMAVTQGSAAITVAVIDGPADLDHPDLRAARIRELPTGRGTAAPLAACTDGAGCRHGTAVLGVLLAPRDAAAPGVCPGCTVLLRPLFLDLERPDSAVTGTDLADAVVDAIAAGARIVSLSLGLDAGRIGPSHAVTRAFDQALRRGVVVVAAAGNHGQVGPAPMLAHPWPVLVTACDPRGTLLAYSNLGIGIGRTGLRAPGSGVLSAAPGGGHQRFSGTSAAVPLVAGTAALLWSLAPNLSAAELRAALLRPGEPRHSIVPPLLDAAASLQALAAR